MNHLKVHSTLFNFVFYGLIGLAAYLTGEKLILFGLATLTNFAEVFPPKTLRRFYQESVGIAISNQDWEGELKKPGDRVNLLSFLHDISQSDYTVGTDMASQVIVDTEEQLVVEKRKYYNFALDRLEDLFTYGQDIPDNLIENAVNEKLRLIDGYVLEKYADAKVSSWIGLSLYVAGSSADTEASIATTAAGGTLTIASGATAPAAATNEAVPIENPRTGNTLLAGFTVDDTGRPIRLTSGQTWATSWYKISAFTDTVTVSITNWDGATSGPHIPNGDILEGLYGDSGGWVKNVSAQNGDGKPTTQAGWGWELGAAEATTIAAANSFEVITELGEALDREETPYADRHITVNPAFKRILIQASELQPSGVEQIYTGTVINGRVMRVSGFDVHVAAGGRVSTRLQHQSSSGTGIGADVTSTANTAQYCILANHKSFVTFAYKWTESRVVDAELQFAKRYQGLYLYGALVPASRRRYGAMVFASFA